MKKKFKSFEDARKFVRTLKLKNVKEWIDYRKSGKKPDYIPSNPNRTYKKDWKGWGDWLGTGTIAFKNINYCSFNEARKFAQSLKLKNSDEWKIHSKSNKIPNNIPSTPHKKYRDMGWISWGDFLGTGNVHSKNFRKFNDAKKYVNKLKLKTQNEWRQYVKSDSKPDDIPNKPGQAYKNKGWKGFGDWLGTGRIASQNMQFRFYEDARKFVHSLGLKNWGEWDDYCKSGNKLEDIPSSPDRVYKNKGWISMGNWLGTGTIATQNRKYRSFKEAKNFVQSLGIKGMREWQEYCVSGNKPDDIPSSPWDIYKEWKTKKKMKLKL